MYSDKLKKELDNLWTKAVSTTDAKESELIRAQFFNLKQKFNKQKDWETLLNEKPEVTRE